jgi:hypothetical protein
MAIKRPVYEGFVQATTDAKRQECYDALVDDSSAIA